MAVYTIRVKGGPSFRCPDHRPILFAAWEQGVVLPYSCRVGGCDRCVARVLTGRVDPSRDRRPPALEGPGVPAHLCRAYPLSDCTIVVPPVLLTDPGGRTGTDERPPVRATDLARPGATTGATPRSASADPAPPAEPAPPG